MTTEKDTAEKIVNLYSEVDRLTTTFEEFADDDFVVAVQLLRAAAAYAVEQGMELDDILSEVSEEVAEAERL